jgi:RNA recognition motif-containing protein
VHGRDGSALIGDGFLSISIGFAERRKPVLEEWLIIMKSIYVGNLPFSATEEDMRNLFSSFGTVHAVKLISDRETGRPRGFAFVEMEDSAAESAISALNGKELGGRTLRINEARERAPRQERNRY